MGFCPGKMTLNFIALAVAAAMSHSVALAADDLVHPGYIDNVSDERIQTTREVVIVPYVEPSGPSVLDRIFTEKMTKEFSREFRHQFGYTEFEQLQFTSNRFVESSDSGRQVQFEDYLEKQEKFGNYLAKEMTQYHLDNYLKSSRTTRQVYKAKEAISNIQVATPSGYKYRLRYKFTSNRLTFNVEKPGEKFHKSIDAKLNGEETALHLAYDVSKTVRLGTDYGISNEIYAIYGSKRLTPALLTSITGQSYARTVGSTPKQDRVLLGLSWND